jgi:hypothetical protein
VGKRCVAPSKKHRTGRRCTRTLVASTFHASVPAGAHTLRVPRLPAGTWTLTLMLTDAAGNASTARKVVLHVR